MTDKLIKSFPQIVDEAGRPVTRHDILQLVTQLSQLAQLARIRKSLEREHFEGRADSRTLPLTDTMEIVDLLGRWPFTAWATAYFFNYGPDAAYISINNAHDWRELRKNEDATYDFTKGDERILRIYHRCNPGETALVTALGKY